MLLVFAMLITSLLPTTAITAKAAQTDVSVRNLMVNNVTNPIGIDTTSPHFSWKMDSSVVGQVQTAYQINVSKAGGENAWDTGKVESDVSIDVAYDGRPLESSTVYEWNVTVWDKDGNATVSENATFEMGLLEEDAFNDTNWIRVPKKGDPDPGYVPPVIDKSVYTIESNLKFKDAFGIVFAAKDKSNFYMWQINNKMEKGVQGTWLRPHVWQGQGRTYNPENIKDYNGYKLDKELASNQDYQFKLVVDTVSKVVETYIDGELINSLLCADADLSYGKIGFRQSSNPSESIRENAWIDDLKVTAKNGEVIFYQDFALGSDTQMEAGVVKDGTLFLDAGEKQSDIVCLSKDSSTYYRFDTDFTIKAGKAGIIYGADKEENQYYYTQVNPDMEGGFAIQQHIKEADGRKYAFDTPGFITHVRPEDARNKKHHFTVTATKGQEVRLYVDGVEVKAHDRLDKFAFDGKIGFNSDANDNVIYDNTVIKVAGEPKFYTDYSSSENPFTEGSIKDGVLEVKGEKTVFMKDVIGNGGGGPIEDPYPVTDPVHYTVESDLTLTGGSAGIIFSATNNSNMFMWQINGVDHPGKLYLRPHIWENGNAHYSEYERDISEFFDYEKDILNQKVHIKIEVTESEIKTTIGDKLVDTFTIDNKTPGKIVSKKVGYRSGAANETFLADNLKVVEFDKDGKETVKLCYDFEDGSNPFAGDRGAARLNYVKDGEYNVLGGSQAILTNDYSAKGMPMFRKTFDTEDKEIASAKVYASSLGVYDLYVNGARVGHKDENGEVIYDEMKPGWTDYNKRVLYYTHDVTDLMKKSDKNVMVATMGTGWWTGRISYDTYGNKDMAFLAKTIITYTDGSTQVINTDSTWKASIEGAYRSADIWDGETYDANYPSSSELSDSSYTEDSNWKNVSYDTGFNGVITAQVGQTIQVRKELERTPEASTVYEGAKDTGTDFGGINVIKEYKTGEPIQLKKGQTVVFDMGQNMVGWPNTSFVAPKGTKLSFHFGEMLNDTGELSRGNDGPAGSLYTSNYRSSLSSAYYIANGKSTESYRPTFTFFGFRYMSITADQDISINSIKAEVLGSAIPEIGTLTTSNSSVNQLISNILWGQRGNYLSVPTDCPQRDERLGWSGDTQAFIGAATYNANVAGFIQKWAQDARDGQSGGRYTDNIPRTNATGDGAGAWGDAGIIVPYTMFKMYGDTQIIKQMYQSMEAYMTWLNGNGDGFQGPEPRYGDWLAPDNPDGTKNNTAEVQQLVSCAYYAYDTQLMAQMSDVIGETEKAQIYRDKYEGIKNYYQNKYIDKNGYLKPEVATQTGYLMTLKVDLYETEEDFEAGKNILVKKIEDNGNKLSTGFVGTSTLNQTLSDIGAVDTAYSLLLQRDNPSWMYSIDQGATTIWERWNSYTKESGFGDVTMNSFNHYAYGAVSEWMYSDMLGIDADPTQPGFKHMILAPQPDTRAASDIPDNQERITHVKGSYDSAYGLISGEWNWTEEEFSYTATIPANTTATVYIPAKEDAFVTVNGQEAEWLGDKVEGIKYVETVDGKAVFEAAAGTYEFKAIIGDAIDMTTLRTAVNEAKELKKTEAYLNAEVPLKVKLDNALTTAQNVLKNDNTTEKAVEAAVNALTKAINDIKSASAPADKELLKALIQEVNDVMGTELYMNASEETKENLDKKLLEAQNVYHDENATEAKIAEAMKSLRAALRGLEEEADKEPQSLTDDANRVTLKAEPGTWPKDTILLAKEIKDGNQKEMVEEALKDVSNEFTIFDIALFSNDIEVSLNEKKAEAVLQIPAYYDPAQLALYHVTKEGTADQIPLTFTDSTQKEVSFTTDQLGMYVWADLRIELPDESGISVNIDGKITNKKHLIWDETARIEEITMVDRYNEAIDLTDAIFTYQTEDKNIAVIDENGLITAKNAGVTNIKVNVSLYGEETTTSITITVTEITPISPKAKQITENSITLNTVDGYEYAIQNGNADLTFTAVPVFTGLKAATTYTVFQRIAGTPTHMAGTDMKALELTTEKETLQGTVALTGTAREGETLTLNTSGIKNQNTGNLTIVWKRGNQVIPGASGTSYKLTKTDVGYQITAEVTAAGFQGMLSAPASQIVALAEIPAEKVIMNKSSLSLEKGKTYTLLAYAEPANTTNKTITWKSEDTSILTVDQNGKVTAKKSGQTKVTAAAVNGKSASCTIRVTQAPTKIKLNVSKKTIGVKESMNLKTTLSPKGAVNKKYTWKTSDKSVVSVNSKGKITGKKAGSATITVTTANRKKASCKITVKKAPTSIKLNANSKTLKKGTSFALKVKHAKGSAGTVTYSSSNKKTATVSSSGKIKAVGKGTATITAKTYNGKKAIIKITVK